MADEFHEKPYDSGTLAKLRIFELYTQEWIPVFLSKANTGFPASVHLFDFFCGPGTDSTGTKGSPLRVLTQLRAYFNQKLAGWGKTPIVVHFHDSNSKKLLQLQRTLDADKWNIPGVTVDVRNFSFQEALSAHSALLEDRKVAKLLIIDQYGVDEVSDSVFKKLASYPTADFIFFLSSSTLHRFRNHPSIKQKIDKVEDSYEVHRAAVAYYRKLLSADDDLYLGSFSIKKKSNIYGLIFGSHHPLGIHKFLQVAWATDEIAGEANFDIERENIRPEEGILPLAEFRPNKIREFERELESKLRSGTVASEADIIRFSVESGMTCRHSAPVLKKLKDEGVLELGFRVPDVKKFTYPRPVKLKSS